MIDQLRKLSKQKKHLIFDFDKTIAQVEIDWTDWHSGVSEIYSRYDINHGYEAGMDPHEYYNILVSKHGRLLATEISKFVSDYEQEHVTGFTPYPEIVEFIKANEDNQLHVFSSNSRSAVKKGLDQLGISNYFQQLITRDEVTKVKPDPEGFYLLEGFETNKIDYLMIGDSRSDEIAAQSAGIDFLRCTYFGTYVFTKVVSQ